MRSAAVTVGVSEIKPVCVLNLSPGVFEIDGEISKLAIAPPVELIVYPLIADPAFTTSLLDESVKAGVDKQTLVALPHDDNFASMLDIVVAFVPQ